VYRLRLWVTSYFDYRVELDFCQVECNLFHYNVLLPLPDRNLTAGNDIIRVANVVSMIVWVSVIFVGYRNIALYWQFC